MAHFAKVYNGIVQRVIVAEQEFVDNYVDSLPGKWVKTSYNMYGGVYYDPATGAPAADQSVITGDEARERKNYAGIGFHYDGTGFYEPKPYASWTFNNTSYLWEPPITMPELTDSQIESGAWYKWDENAYNADNTQGWVLVE